jgi:ABC-type multidrug transport system ATPase subunit
MNAAIEVEGPTKRYGGTLSLNDASFDVQQGDVLALLPFGGRL